MEYLPDKGYKRILVIAAYAVIGLIIGWLILKFALPLFLPFIIAYITAMVTRPISRRISKTTKIKFEIASVFVILLFLLIICIICGFLCSSIMAEVRELVTKVTENADSVLDSVFGLADKISEKLPFLDTLEDREMADKVRSGISGFINKSAAELSSKIPEKVMTLVSSLPEAILFVFVLIVSIFYMSTGIDRVNKFIRELFPKNVQKKFSEIKARLFKTGIKYLKAYTMLLAITFFELTAGFLIVGIEYPLTIAAVIAFLDILPVLGVGTVLIPWSIVMFIMGDYYTAISLLIIFGITSLIRQIIEPKIVGASIGLPPLVTFTAMYVGYKLLGVAGLFLLPAVVITVMGVLPREAPSDSER